MTTSGLPSSGRGRWEGMPAEDEAIEAVEIGIRTAAAIWRFWLMRGYFSEGREQLSNLLALRRVEIGERAKTERAEGPDTQGSKRYWANALNGAGILAYEQ